MTNALRDAEHTAAVVSAMGPTVFPVNGPARIAEGMLQAAIAEAQTNRLDLLMSLFKSNGFKDEEVVPAAAECTRLIALMTTTEGSDDAENA